MLETANPAIKRLFIMALADAGHPVAFLDLALPWLTLHSDHDLEAKAVSTLFDEGRYGDVIALPRVDSLTCESRGTCRSVMFLALAYLRSGNPVGARQALMRVRTSVAAFAGEERRWKATFREVTGEEVP